MKDIIKQIIQIDKIAIRKEEDYKAQFEDLEKQKKIQLKMIKEDNEICIKKQLEDYQNLISSQIITESAEIKSSSKIKAIELRERYERFEEKVVQDSFDMILRYLEG